MLLAACGNTDKAEPTSDQMNGLWRAALAHEIGHGIDVNHIDRPSFVDCSNGIMYAQDFLPLATNYAPVDSPQIRLHRNP